MSYAIKLPICIAAFFNNVSAPECLRLNGIHKCVALAASYSPCRLLQGIKNTPPALALVRCIYFESAFCLNLWPLQMREPTARLKETRTIAYVNILIGWFNHDFRVLLENTQNFWHYLNSLSSHSFRFSFCVILKPPYFYLQDHCHRLSLLRTGVLFFTLTLHRSFRWACFWERCTFFRVVNPI